MMMELVGLLGCEQIDGPKVYKNETFTTPEGCYKKEDLRAEFDRGYQVLCRDEKGNLELYTRNGGKWYKFMVK